MGLLAAMISIASSADVPFMVALKGQRFAQTGPTVVALSENDNANGDEALVFEAFAMGATANSIVSGNLGLPGGGSVPLEREDPGDTEFGYSYRTETLLDLNTIRPNGEYTFNLTTKNDGAQTASVSLAGNTYPNVPQITNYNGLQSAPHTAAITVQWAAMTGGTLNDFILFSVAEADTGNTVYESGEPGAAGALNGTSLQATIPAATLLPGRSYEAEVLFIKVVDVDDTSYPSATAIAGYYKLVEFEINTQPQSGAALGAMFERALPQDNAWDVGRDSVISFQFSHPMNPSYRSVSWTGVSPSNFFYEWIDGNKRLTCRYNVSLPANVDVGWSLDLSGFRDAAGFPLNGTQEGSFHTSEEDPASPPDVHGFYALKSRSYNQTGASPPVSDGMYGCDMGVDLTAYNRVKAATVTMLANTRSLAMDYSDWDPEMEVEATYASKADLDRFFANGDFQFDMTTLDDGLKSVTLSLGATDDYPAPPTVTNLAALQAIDPSVPTTITWNALPGWSTTIGIGNGMIELEIDGTHGEVFWLDNEDLTSGSQCVIPAGTLWPGRTYQVNLIFTKIKDLDDTTYPDVMGGVGFSTVTEFTIQTTGSPVLPNIEVAESGDAMNLNFTGGEPQRCYVVETSRDMLRWVPIDQRWMNGDPNSFYDNDARYVGLRFYRLRDCGENEQIQFLRSIQGTVWTDNTQSTPVAGAVMGTSMDGQTVVTDSSGQFFLETETPNGSGPYTVRVNDGSTQKDFGPFTDDQPRGQNFWMN